MSTQAQVLTACATLTLANAQAWKAIQDPAARDAYVGTLLVAATPSISPIDDYAITQGCYTLRNLLPTAP